MPIFEWLTILSIFKIVQSSSYYTSEDAPSTISFLAADERAVYRAVLYEAGATAVDLRWSLVVGSPVNATSLMLTDFDFDATRRRLVFANSDPTGRTLSVSECYLLRPNEDHLSCTLTTSLIYRQINVSNNGIFVTLDWLTGDVYILLPGLFVRCPLPINQGHTSSDCIETKISETINPSIVRLDPFSRSLIWNQKRSYKPGRQQFCLGINRATLTQQVPFSDSTCLLNDATVTSIFVNHTTGAVIFTNSSRDSIFQLTDSTVLVARKFANEGYADSVVNCPTPVRSLTHFEETDVFFWTAPDVRKRQVRVDFSQILAFEVDGLCSSHPTSKDLSRVTILMPTPRLDDTFLKSTLTDQVRCHCNPSENVTLQVSCHWVYAPIGHEKNTFFVVEIGNQLYYRTSNPSFNTVLTKEQLVGDLKMSDAVALHIAIRVCSKWHCALPANVYIQQSPFAPTSIQAYRVFANVLPSFSMAVRWHLPTLFQAVTSVTLVPDSAPDTFYHQSTIQEEAIFDHLNATTSYVAKIETCNIWNCSETSKFSFKPDELKFEPIMICWRNSTPSLTMSSAFYLPIRRNYSNSVFQTGSQGVQSTVYIMSLGGKNGSIAWIDAEKWRIFLTLPSGETRLIVDAPNAGQVRRHSLSIDLLTFRLFWVETDLRNNAELHGVKLEIRQVSNQNQQHFVYQLPNDQVWTRLTVNSTAGVLFVLSGDAMAPTGALVFDLLSNKISTNFENEITTSVDRILTTERHDFPQNCHPVFDENAVSLYDNRVCFDLQRTDLITKNASTPDSISVSLVSVVNELCQSKSVLRRFALQSVVFYLADGPDFETCRRDKNCQQKELAYENNGTVTFTRLQAFSDYQLFAEMTLPLFNQSRFWQLGRVRTQPAVPNEPRNFRCARVTPEEVLLEWQPPTAFNGPSDQIEFILKWKEPSEQDQKKLVDRSMEVDGSKPVAVTHLQPDWLYEFRLAARSRLFPSTLTSQTVFARCRTSSVGKFSVMPVALERSKLGFKFHPSLFSSTNSQLMTASVSYGLASELRFCSLAVNTPDYKAAKRVQLCSGPSCSQSEPITNIINDLQPKTFYRFCLILNYGDSTSYIYPQYFNLVVETGGFKLEAPRVWTSFAGIEVLLFASGNPPKIMLTTPSPVKNNSSFENKNQNGDFFQLLYSDENSFCQNNANFSNRVFSRNVTSSARTVMALRKEDFEIDRRYWFRLSLTVDDQMWFSDCSDPVSIHLNNGETNISVPRSPSVLTSLIALISCVSVVAFCLSLFAFIFLFRRVNSRLSSAKMFVGRYFCRLLDYSGLSNPLRNRNNGYRFEFNNFSSHHFVGTGVGTADHRSRSLANGGLILPGVYSTSSSGGASTAAILQQQQQQQQTNAQTMTLMNAGRGHTTSGGLWSLSTLSPDTSPVTATSSTGPGGIGAGSVFSFDCDGTGLNSSGTFSKGTFPLRFLTLANQIYATPAGLTNWLHHLPPNVLRLSREQITISRFLGAGAFGEVYEGELAVVDETTKQVVTSNVAVKTLKPDADSDRRASFCREAALMSHFNHPNIVRLIGMCIAPSPHCAPIAIAPSALSAWPLMVLELMNGGDLLGYLRRARQATEKSLSLSTSTSQIHQPATNLGQPDNPYCLKMVDLFDICIDVASGCRYLEKNRFCHRDIAARNCLVSCPVDPETPGRRIVKIGDFGLARTLDGSAECYRKVGEGLMPVRWMSPESLNDGIFTTQSDIWSFGVLMFEVFSLGRQPYAGRANHEVFEMVKIGSHPECPRECPTSVCRLMLSCFQMLPENRPSFKMLLQELKTIRTNTVASNRRNVMTVEKSRSSSNLTTFSCLKSKYGNSTASFAVSVPAYATLARQKLPGSHNYQLGPMVIRPQKLSFRHPPMMRSESDATTGLKSALHRHLSTSAMAIAPPPPPPISHKTLVPVVDDSNGAAKLDDSAIMKIKVSENVTKQLLAAKANHLQIKAPVSADISIVSHVHNQHHSPVKYSDVFENTVESVFI